MAFDQSKFSPVSSHASDSPAVYTYITGDTLADVQAVGYFIDKQFQLEKGDILLVDTSGDVHTKLIVGADTSSAVSSNTVTKTTYYEDTDDQTYVLTTGLYVDIGLEVAIDVGSTLTEDFEAGIRIPSIVGTNNNTSVKLALLIDDVIAKEVSAIIGNTETSLSMSIFRLRGLPENSGSLVVKIQALNGGGDITIDNSVDGVDGRMVITQSTDVEI